MSNYKAGAIYEFAVGAHFHLIEERKEGSAKRGDRFLMLEDEKEENELVKVLLLGTNEVVLIHQWRMFWRKIN